MPIYDYLCSNCGEQPDIWATISDNGLSCPKCGQMMFRLLSAPNVIPDLKPYLDENLATGDNPAPVWVESRQHRRQLMKERGLAEK